MRKKVRYGLGKARFDVPVPCTIRRILVEIILSFELFLFSLHSHTHHAMQEIDVCGCPTGPL